MRCRVKTECNGTRAESRFGLPAKRTSPFMLLVVFMLDSDYSPSSVTTNNINGLVRFAGRPNLLSARVPLHSVFTLPYFSHYLINGKIFGRTLLNIKCVLIFPTTFVRDISL